MTPKEISIRILEIAPSHGLPQLRLRPRRESLTARALDRVLRLVSPSQDHMRTLGNDLIVPDGHYWNPPPPHVLIHELAHSEQRKNLGRILFRLGYGGLSILHLLTGPLMLLPVMLSMVVPWITGARLTLLAALAAELVVLGNYASWASAGAVGLLVAGYAPFCSPIRAQLEFEAYVIDALFISWSQDMAWDPRFVRRYGDLPAPRLRWIHDTISGPSTYWAVRRARGKRMLAEVSRAPEELLLRYPRVLGLWQQLHKEYVAHMAATAPTPTSTSADATPKP